MPDKSPAPPKTQVQILKRMFWDNDVRMPWPKAYFNNFERSYGNSTLHQVNDVGRVRSTLNRLKDSE